MTARALERARATLDCVSTPNPRCKLLFEGDCAFDGPEWSCADWHYAHASLCLDGVSVRAVTAAERELER